MPDRGPVSTAELARWLDRHERESVVVHADLVKLIERLERLIERLDERTDRLSIRVAIIFSVATVAWAVIVIVAPLLRAQLGMS